MHIVAVLILLLASAAVAGENEITVEQQRDYMAAILDLEHKQSAYNAARQVVAKQHAALEAACGDRGLVPDPKGFPSCGKKPAERPAERNDAK